MFLVLEKAGTDYFHQQLNALAPNVTFTREKNILKLPIFTILIMKSRFRNSYSYLQKTSDGP